MYVIIIAAYALTEFSSVSGHWGCSRRKATREDVMSEAYVNCEKVKM